MPTTKTRDPEVVLIFDTTLRDGEQSPGASLTSEEKLEVARQLARLGVDIMEAGFPAASPDDLEAVQRIASEVGGAISSDGMISPSASTYSRIVFLHALPWPSDAD